MINWCDFTADNLVSCPVLLLVFLTPFQPVQANNFLEIDRHQAVYRVVVGIVRELAAQHCLVSLLGPLPDQATSLHCLLQGMESQARIMIDKIGELPELLTARPAGPGSGLDCTAASASTATPVTRPSFVFRPAWA